MLPKQEKEALLEKLDSVETALPKILMSDPALTNTEVKPGDVIKISRKSQTAGKSTYYRIVVDK